MKHTMNLSHTMNMETAISWLLRIGVLLSALIVSAGGVWYLFQHGAKRPEYASFVSEPSDLRSPQSTLKEAEHFDSPAVIMAGLLVLIATPIFRVAFTAVAFAAEKDWMYVAFAGIVLVLLLYSIGH
jgi:uncharacterized membrane protein